MYSGNNHSNVNLLQSSEHNRSLDELDEEENHVLPPLDHETHEDVEGPPQVIRCGGEDGDTGGTMLQRQRLNADMPDSSVVRRGRGKDALCRVCCDVLNKAAMYIFFLWQCAFELLKRLHC